MARFTDYQRKIWTVFSFCSVCRFQINKDSKGKYSIQKAGLLRILFYYFMWLNFIIKIIFLMMTYQGLLLRIHFLDQMSMWDWFLGAFQLVQAVNIWYRKYPLYELLHANWTVYEDIFSKLGSPSRLDAAIHKNDKFLVIMHTSIVMVGCNALMFQFFSDPKNPLFIYAIIPYDNLLLRVIFAAHEYLYMFYIWIHQAGTIVLMEIMAVTNTHLLREMTIVMYRLIELGKANVSEESWSQKSGRRRSIFTAIENEIKWSDNKHQFTTINTDLDKTSIEVSATYSHPNSKKHESFLSKLSTSDELLMKRTSNGLWKIRNRKMNLNKIVPGTEYDFPTLLQDYRNLMVTSNAWNKWVGLLMGGTNMCNYGQFVSDVFMMIQLLKEPDTDLLSITFYAEDACAGMAMLFYMFILMSRMPPASQEFLQSFNLYLQYEFPGRKYYVKLMKTIRKIGAKIGGGTVTPGTVPKAIDAIIKYYISAAMWQRPSDRLT